MSLRSHCSGTLMKRFTPRPAGRVAATMLSALVLSVGIALGAATSSSQDVLGWAQAALQRNAALEVVSADSATGIITVRIKRTGEIRHVRADELIAALPQGAAESPALPTNTESSEASQEQPGRVLVAGPGYRITAVGPGEAASGSSPQEATGGALLASSPVERRHEPIICQGVQLLHIDSRNLEFDGDAVSAENGCEVHITNSRIVARGIGVTARSASVHIDNSSIEGGEDSIEASDGAQVYARSSTFRGLIRRLDTAAFHDMGGNVGD